MKDWRKKLSDHLPGRKDSSRQADIPGIPGRSAEHDGATPTGVPPERQAHVTEEQRELEREIREDPSLRP
jgi:hypothetical protein